MRRWISLMLITAVLCGSVSVYGGAADASVPFADVAAGSYYYDAVRWAVELQVTNGVDAAHFAPGSSCTRAQVVTFLWRAKGSFEPRSEVSPFADVKPGSYYEQAVLWALENGITKGTSDTEFSPDATCTRGQIVTFLHRFEGLPCPSDTAVPFLDVRAGAYYETAVRWAVEAGVTKGTSETAFSPNATCTRGQVVTFLYREAMDG